MEDDETFHHFITSCPAFWESRRNILQDSKVDSNQEWSVRNILIFSNLPGIREAIDGQTDLRLYGILDDSDEASNDDYPP